MGFVGPVNELTHKVSSVNTLATHSLRIDSNPPEKDMNEKLKRFRQLESIGIKENENSVYENSYDGIHSNMEGLKFICYFQTTTN